MYEIFQIATKLVISISYSFILHPGTPACAGNGVQYTGHVLHPADLNHVHAGYAHTFNGNRLTAGILSEMPAMSALTWLTCFFMHIHSIMKIWDLFGRPGRTDQGLSVQYRHVVMVDTSGFQASTALFT
jgi:hypothetical protein